MPPVSCTEGGFPTVEPPEKPKEAGGGGTARSLSGVTLNLQRRELASFLY